MYSDIDECSTLTGLCDDHATCNDSDGSYICTCDNGYEGDGLNCTGEISRIIQYIDSDIHSVFIANLHNSYTIKMLTSAQIAAAFVMLMLTAPILMGVTSVPAITDIVEVDFNVKVRGIVQYTFNH